MGTRGSKNGLKSAAQGNLVGFDPSRHHKISNLSYRRFRAWSRLCPSRPTRFPSQTQQSPLLHRQPGAVESNRPKTLHIHRFAFLPELHSGEIVDLRRRRRAYLLGALKRHRPFPQCANSVARNLTEIRNGPMISTRPARLSRLTCGRGNARVRGNLL